MSIEEQPLYAVDLDQTLLDTESIFDETVTLCERQGIVEEGVLRDARLRVEASGGSFDAMTYLKDNGVSEAAQRQLTTTLGSNEQYRDFLYSDARDFLSTLDGNELPSLIITWGSIRNQLAKLQATGLDQRAYLITQVSQKGEIIKGWRTAEYYRVSATAGQILVGQTCVLVDDKVKSFIGLPEDCSGFLVQRNKPKRSQMGPIPDNVLIVPNLATITEIVK